jgi:outer membrane protein W
MKTLFLTVSALLVTLASMAQENLSFGPVVGVSIANLRGDISNNDWKTGLTAGGFINYSTESGFGLTGQVLYTQLGAQTANKTNQLRLNYLQIPVLATYYFGQRGNLVRPKLFLGPHLGFLLNSADKNGNEIKEGDGSNPFNSVDLGATFGAGVNIRILPKIWLNTDVRYGLGLLDVTKNGSTSVQNQNWGVNLGLSFPLGRIDDTETR